MQTADVIGALGPVFLGSRLKRLGERFQAGAAHVLGGAGIDAQPAHMPLLTALDQRAMTVGELVEAVGTSQPNVTRAVNQLVELGLVQSKRGRDGRQRSLALTRDGRAAMVRVKLQLWPRISKAVEAMCAGLDGPILEQIAALESALEDKAFEHRVADVGFDSLRIHDFTDALAREFHDINAEWIRTMFRLEATDRDVLQNPRERIIRPGGAILFVEAPGLGIVGTCALQKTGKGAFELTKMGVRPGARGLKAGEFLLAATIARAKLMGAESLYLLTNKKCEAAIHLYEKLGFEHDAEIMRQYGARYKRCDVAMRYRGR
jgi:ribosomal protein S18 acetylase RimI-like enzyme/DNA-binding transcriptional ArsR family regulator